MNRTLQIMRKQFGVATDAKKGSFLSGVGKFFNLMTDPLDNAITSLFNKWTGAGLTGAEVAQNQFNAEQADIARQENRDLANTQYQRGVADMQAAGLNPALAYSQGGAPTPNAPSASAGSSSNGMDFQQLISLLMLPMQLKQMKSAIDLQYKQADKVAADTDLVKKETDNKQLYGEIMKLDRDFLSSTFEARKQGQELANSMTQVQIRQGYKNLDIMDKQLDKLAAETDNEIERKQLIIWQTAFQKASVQQIEALLPLQQKFIEAQTAAQKAIASAQIANAAYQNGMIEAGAIEAQVNLMKEQIRKTANESDVEAAESFLKQYEIAIKTGNISYLLDYANRENTQFTERTIPDALFAAFGLISTTIGSIFK